jgi:hypothetical protein
MKRKMSILSFGLIANIVLLSTSVFAGEPEKADKYIQPPILSTHVQDAFFNRITQHCGKAYAGKVIEDTSNSPAFANKALIMHVRSCEPNQLKIPFYVGDDASRTWIITKTGAGLSLKHDHRHKDGTSDQLTMYGGHTHDAGWSQVQSFPADAPTKEMFTVQGLPQSNTNIWQIYIYPDTFSYRLVREGREFRVDFDLKKPIETPADPWGY